MLLETTSALRRRQPSASSAASAFFPSIYFPSAALLTALLDVNLSCHSLIRVAEGLEPKDLITTHLLFLLLPKFLFNPCLMSHSCLGKIVVLKYKENGQDYIKEYGLHIGMDGYGFAILSGTETAPWSPPMHKTWEFSLSGVGKNIARIPTRELGIGFRAGMHNYVVQVVGLVYINSKYNVKKFWEMYNMQMESIIRPDDLVDKSTVVPQ